MHEITESSFGAETGSVRLAWTNFIHPSQKGCRQDPSQIAAWRMLPSFCHLPSSVPFVTGDFVATTRTSTECRKIIKDKRARQEETINNYTTIRQPATIFNVAYGAKKHERSTSAISYVKNAPTRPRSPSAFFLVLFFFYHYVSFTHSPAHGCLSVRH